MRLRTKIAGAVLASVAALGLVSPAWAGQGQGYMTYVVGYQVVSLQQGTKTFSGGLDFDNCETFCSRELVSWVDVYDYQTGALSQGNAIVGTGYQLINQKSVAGLTEWLGAYCGNVSAIGLVYDEVTGALVDENVQSTCG